MDCYDSDDSVYIFEVNTTHNIDFECAGDEVLVETSPPASPDMAARLATPAQGTGAGGGSPSTVRELIVIPELPNSIQLQHAIQQVSTTVVEVNGDSSGQSSPNTDGQHTYITVSMNDERWEDLEEPVEIKIENIEKSEGGTNVNYHVQYVEQDIFTQTHQPHMETLRTYPVYGVTTVGNETSTDEAGENGWGGASSAEYTAYGVVVAGDEAETARSPATPQPPRMPPATVQWLLAHYETAEGVSLPRSTLYAHYLRHCTSHRLEPVNAASFGKLIRSVFIGLRTRRLGTRGNSKYHYYGIRAKSNASSSPVDTQEDKTELELQEESPPCAALPPTHRQYLGCVGPPAPPALPPLAPPHPAAALRDHHRQHGIEFLEAVAALDIAAVERSRRSFWRRPPPELCRKLHKMTAKKEVANWLKEAELELYQKAVELLLPDVLKPIPPQLTQSIRNFAKTLESALASGSLGAPPPAARAQAAAAAALAAALRRYTSLNHLAQAARAVLNNQHQIQQMVSDLSRVDFRVVREQAAWACACHAGHAAKLEHDFKATLGRGASLEQWARWLEGCVSGALEPHRSSADYVQRARRLLLDWSFYSSLVIRELTLRSAASFGSFHLIRLLYDEYVSYLIERRVAEHLQRAPIAVMYPHQEDDQEEAADEGSQEVDEDDPDWEWADEDEDDDDPPQDKKAKLDLSERL